MALRLSGLQHGPLLNVVHRRPDKAKPPSGIMTWACLMALRLSGQRQKRKKPIRQDGLFTLINAWQFPTLA